MESLVALAIATSVLVLIPGPNVALIVGTSLRSGFSAGAAAVLGTTAGVGIQLVVVIAGLASLVAVFAEALLWLKWIGVVYLLYLGITSWRTPAEALNTDRVAQAMFWRGCVVAVLNPKTLLFNAAFLPQFVSSGAGFTGWAAAGVVFLSVMLVGDLLWAAFAHSARPVLGRVSGLQNRLSGAFFVLAAIGLASARRITG